MELTGDFVQSMTKIANESSFLAFELEPVVYPQIFKVVDVEQEYGGRDFGQMTEIIGQGEPVEIGEVEDHKFFDIGEGWICFWALRFWQRGFRLTRNQLKNWASNPKLAENFVQTQSQQLGARFAQRRDQLCADVFNRGAISAGDVKVLNGSRAGVQVDSYPGKIYDGQPFFSTVHPLKRDAATTFSNFAAASAISPANLKAAITALRVTNAKDEHNKPITQVPDTIVYNPTLDFEIREILNSTLIAGSANNNANSLQNILNPVPWQKITGTDDWAIGRAKKGLIAHQRGTGPRMVSQVKEFEGVGVLEFSYIDEFAVCVHQWRDWYGANFPTA